MSKFLAGVGVSLLVVVIAAGAYFLGRSQTPDTLLPSPLVSPSAAVGITSPSSSAPVGFTNSTATTAAIKEMIPDKKYKDLAPFMADNVNVIIYASSCCGDYTKAQAIDQLKYLDAAKAPWDFDQASAIVQKLALDVPQYFKDKTIGVASNKYTVAFGLNSKFLIDKIVLVVDYSIVAPF